LIESTAKWPKSARFSLVQKVDNHALDIVEMLVVARYEPSTRRKTLREINLRLERLRFLLRIARTRNVMPADKFESAMRGVDELGRMLHGWRVAIGERMASDAAGERMASGQPDLRGERVVTGEYSSIRERTASGEHVPSAALGHAEVGT
jgi:hypothetical protein